MSPQATTDYCVELHRRNSEQLGFIPRDSLLRYAEDGRIWTASEGGEYCGFLVGGNAEGRAIARIYQACIEYDLRRLRHGIELVERFERDAARGGSSFVTLRCRSTNEAVEFWKAAGYKVVDARPGGAKRGRPLLVFAKQIERDLFG